MYGKDYLGRVLGTHRAMQAQHSPINQLASLKARAMLIVGGRDTRVPPVQGEHMHAALLARGIRHVWLYKADEWHGFHDEDNIAELFEQVDAFLAADIGSGAASPAQAAASMSAR